MISAPARHRASQLGWTTGIPRASFSHLPCFCHIPKALSQSPCPEIIDPQKWDGESGGWGTLEVTPSCSSSYFSPRTGNDFFPNCQTNGRFLHCIDTVFLPWPSRLLCGHCVYIVTSSPGEGWELLRHLGRVGECCHLASGRRLGRGVVIAKVSHHQPHPSGHSTNPASPKNT